MSQLSLIDTHGHLSFAGFDDTWEEVAERSFARGVEAIVMPSAQYPTSLRSIELAKQKSGKLFAAVGLHPTHVPPQSLVATDPEFRDNKFESFDYEAYAKLALAPEVVAIGEVGLDTYHTSETLPEQEAVLEACIAIALAVNKPVILHCRAAKKPGDAVTGTNPHERLIELLTRLDERPAFVVHCYQGTAEQAKRYLALGGLISFTGTITYSDDPAVTEVVRAVPLERMLLETDSPYLSPVPYRGEQNEPWKVVEVARRVAHLKGIAIEQVAEATTRNARQFFKLTGGGQ